MKRTKEHKEIPNVIGIAKEYIKAGYEVGQAIDMAKEDFRVQEIKQYEK